jgi:hypothetical protein
MGEGVVNAAPCVVARETMVIGRTTSSVGVMVP